ncbi:MAG: hypothetical protein HC897_10160, partial [Thermoanaerobaculia bacterium]|nr:hypothetical protein [Thermoanaerobaculia bacterium]
MHQQHHRSLPRRGCGPLTIGEADSLAGHRPFVVDRRDLANDDDRRRTDLLRIDFGLDIAERADDADPLDVAAQRGHLGAELLVLLLEVRDQAVEQLQQVLARGSIAQEGIEVAGVGLEHGDGLGPGVRCAGRAEVPRPIMAVEMPVLLSTLPALCRTSLATAAIPAWREIRTRSWFRRRISPSARLRSVMSRENTVTP